MKHMYTPSPAFRPSALVKISLMAAPNIRQRFASPFAALITDETTPTAQSSKTSLHRGAPDIKLLGQGV